MKGRLYFHSISGALIMLLVSVSLHAQNPKLTGYIKGIKDKPIQFWYTQNGDNKEDVVYAKNDRFTYIPKVSDDGRTSIYISGGRFTSFWYEPVNITVEGSIEKPYALLIKGGAKNNLNTLYNTTIEWYYLDKMQGKPDSVKTRLEEEKRKASLAFIKKYNTNSVSAHLLKYQVIRDEKYIDVYDQLYNDFSADVKQSYAGKAALKQINIVKNQPVIGKQAPDFTLADTSGQNVSLSTYKGKYVLLDFWGHWCGGCIKNFPVLKDFHDQNSDKLVVIGIGAELKKDKQKWLNSIKENQLNWTHVSEFEGDKGPVNEKYNIVEWPTYLLLDKEGKVMGRVNHLEDLTEMVKNLQ